MTEVPFPLNIERWPMFLLCLLRTAQLIRLGGLLQTISFLKQINKKMWRVWDRDIQMFAFSCIFMHFPYSWLCYNHVATLFQIASFSGKAKMFRWNFIESHANAAQNLAAKRPKCHEALFGPLDLVERWNMVNLLPWDTKSKHQDSHKQYYLHFATEKESIPNFFLGRQTS